MAFTRVTSRMAEMFPVLDGENENSISWDYDNEFQCDKLAVYFEINCPSEETVEKTKSGKPIVHPDSVERLVDQGSAMRFYESSRALKGDEGPEMANLVTAVERKRLYQQRKIWKKKHGSLWHLPDPLDVVRVHPAMTLKGILSDPRMVVANVSCDDSVGPLQISTMTLTILLFLSMVLSSSTLSS